MHAKSATIDTGRAHFVRAAAFLCIAFAIMLSIPFTAHAQSGDPSTDPSTDPNATGDPTTPQLTTQGIFGCLGRGAQVSNVGTTRAIGGVYVPVNDAAVTLNTGYLVYKECVLDSMSRKVAENALAEFTRQGTQSFERGRNGAQQYLVNFGQEDRQRGSAIAYAQLQNGVSPICEAYRRPVQVALAHSYAQQFNSPNQMIACPMPGSAANQQAFYENREFLFDALFGSIEPCGNAFNCYITEQANIDSMIAYDQDNYRRMLDWGNGVFPVYDNAQDPLAQRVLTPGYLIANSMGQMFGSGFRQLENANEIDQIVSNLFGGLTTRLLSSATGIPGLFVSTGNQPAYINRMVADTRAAVRSGAVNAAVVAMSGIRQSESAYLEAKQGIANALISAITQLRSIENQCWDLIIPAVQTHAQANGNPTLVIATSTQFSQPIIDSQIRSLASTTAADINVSQQALTRINDLIAQVTNSSSSGAQQQALLQIDQMIANGQIHSQQDAQNAASQRDSVTSALTTLVNDTKTAWGDSTDPNVGWCNVNNTAVVERWFNAWRQ